MKNKVKEYNSSIIDNILQEITPEEAKKVENRMLLAAKIDDALKEMGWRKKDLADALGKRPSEITKWLSGTHNFTTDTLWDIERVLGITIISLEEKPKEQVITYHLSVSQKNEAEKPGDFIPYLYDEKSNILLGKYTCSERKGLKGAYKYEA